MNSRSSRKPRSSISSASSSTTMASAETSSARRSIWSRKRPGVPTTIWTPACKARRSRCASMPPTQAQCARRRVAIEPGQLALHLQRQFARRRDDQRERRAGRRQRRGLAEQRLRHRDAIGDGLARAGLGRNQEIAARGLRGGRRRPEPASAPDSRVPPERGRGRDSM